MTERNVVIHASRRVLIGVTYELTREDLGRLAFASWDGEEYLLEILARIYDNDADPWEQFYEGVLSVFDKPVVAKVALKVA